MLSMMLAGLHALKGRFAAGLHSYISYNVTFCTHAESSSLTCCCCRLIWILCKRMQLAMQFLRQDMHLQVTPAKARKGRTSLQSYMRGRLDVQGSGLLCAFLFCPGLSASAARAPCHDQNLLTTFRYHQFTAHMQPMGISHTSDGCMAGDEMAAAH